MAGLDLGPIGVTLDVKGRDGYLDHAAMLEDLGYSTIWISGGQLATLDPLREVIRATERVPVGSAIIPAQVYAAADVLALRRDIEAANPGRLITGVGGAHGPHPLRQINAYLDELDAGEPPVPVGNRILSALGPRMLELARTRAAGAIPLLVTPEYTARARAVLGNDSLLAVMQFVVMETELRPARDAVRDEIRFLTQVGGYPPSLRRMGFTDEQIMQVSDRFIDDLVAWGDADAVAARVREHLDAGADQVVLIVRSTNPDTAPLPEWHTLAAALIA